MPEKLDRCVQKVMRKNPSYSRSKAFAICNESLKDKKSELEVEEKEKEEDVNELIDTSGFDPDVEIGHIGYERTEVPVNHTGGENGE
jgi:hypothetical protein